MTGHRHTHAVSHTLGSGTPPVELNRLTMTILEINATKYTPNEKPEDVLVVVTVLST